MKKDNFWKIFWMITTVFLFLCVGAVGWLKFSYMNMPEDTNLALAVGALFDPNNDPFQRMIGNKAPTSLSNGYFYEESKPYGFDDWSWDVSTTWRTKDVVYEGSYAARIDFLKEWAGTRLNSLPINISSYNSITLAVYPSESTKDIYIELYDRYGNPQGRQWLGWYTDTSSLEVNSWNIARIPIDNLVNTLDTKKSITGFSIESDTPGTVFVDAVQLSKEVITKNRWVEPAPIAGEAGEWIGSNPFKNTNQVELPYAFNTEEDISPSWKNLFGRFEKTKDGILMGATSKKTTGSMTVFGGGQNWQNYRTDATVYWGIMSAFSLLGRFQNDKNFVSCAYSNYGMNVQIYFVKDGESTMMGQTPTLAVRDFEPWKNVKHSMEIHDNKVSCFLDGEKVLSADLPDLAPAGTVGLETWSKNSDDYPHKLVSLTIKPL